MTVVVAIVGVAALFGLFGLVRHRPACGGSCGACGVGTCERVDGHG